MSKNQHAEIALTVPFYIANFPRKSTIKNHPVKISVKCTQGTVLSSLDGEGQKSTSQE